MAPQLPEADDDLAVPLDSLLSSVGRVVNTRLLPGREAFSLLGALARRPCTAGDRLVRLAVEYAGILAGTSDTAPSARDRRFADPGWTENPFLRRVLQCYLATGGTVLQLVDDAELDDQTHKRLRLLVGNLVDALSPSNNVFLNPQATKVTIDTRGANLVRGAKERASAGQPGRRSRERTGPGARRRSRGWTTPARAGRGLIQRVPGGCLSLTRRSDR
jgi:hypothetical protein